MNMNSLHKSAFSPGVRVAAFLVIAMLGAGPGSASTAGGPAANRPDESVTKAVPQGQICAVRREVYAVSPRPGAAPVVSVGYLGKGLRRREVHGLEAKSDLAEKIRIRCSDDNGRTWTPFVPVDAGTDTLRQGENYMEEITFALAYDPVSRRDIEMVFQRVFLGEPEEVLGKYWRGEKKFYDHMMYRLSADEGRTWTEARQLAFEKGAVFDPKDWAKPEFLHANEMYGSYDVTILGDGRVAYAAVVPVPYEEDEEDRRVCAGIPNYAAPGCLGGVICFVGKWNPARGDYDWTAARPLYVPRRVSTRGLMEPIIAELKDGTLLLEMRGSNAGLDPVKYPGRKWMSLSRDGGRTWTPVTDLRFDTGESFYAPSTLAKFIRSRKSGKLYWVGNICRGPAKGNLPRYPLCIAEVDEKIPALVKSSLTVIDDRGPGDTETVQFSNFSLLENRETLDLEIYLSRLGEKPDSPFSADCYKYTLILSDR